VADRPDDLARERLGLPVAGVREGDLVDPQESFGVLQAELQELAAEVWGFFGEVQAAGFAASVDRGDFGGQVCEFAVCAEQLGVQVEGCEVVALVVDGLAEDVLVELFSGEGQDGRQDVREVVQGLLSVRPTARSSLRDGSSRCCTMASPRKGSMRSSRWNLPKSRAAQ